MDSHYCRSCDLMLSCERCPLCGSYGVCIADKENMPLIEKRSDVCGGSACIAGTRLTVWGLVAYQRLGWSDAKLLEAYLQLTQVHLVAAWLYAAYHENEIDREIKENQ